ncbi:hypothetical protein C5167_020141 [Papaver somniferum]|uniref:PPM-type phosphatase domain-containing protein n=1 Tax=Papaver somniferum TaxID=3469 RepID=A0A4Y7IW34_PAPSO|nr:probable protein phosphatase 2C 12 [Papaver somniferum]RZC51718.1 hypothetical protein C5167_020141 [Papaver somniferum]
MGMCISSVKSSNIHDENTKTQQDIYQNAIFIHSSSSRTPIGSVSSQQGQKGINQDSAILQQGFGMDAGVFCGVFDGHGKNGQIASRLVRSWLPGLILNQKKAISSLDLVSSKDSVEEWSKACVGAYKVMDKELKLQENLDCSCSGTTSVTVIKQGEDLVIANLGDSRAVLGTRSDNGELMAVQLTTDLKPSVPEEVERIKKSNGRVFALENEPHIPRVWLPDQNFPGLAMTRAFGDFELKDYGVIAIPQISHHHLNINDKFVVLASDGVWDVLSNQQVVSIVSSSRPETAAREVVDAAVNSWKQKFPSSKMDDISVSCMFF